MEFSLKNEEDVKPSKESQPKTDIIKLWQKELDGYFEEMYKFGDLEPDEIFRKLSAWTSRASYIRGQIVRINNKRMQWFRTQEIDPFITECDRQFKNWSRTFSVQSLDWNMQRGQT